MDLTGKTTAELLAIRRTRKFTSDERVQIFGDVSKPAYSRSAELVRRLDAGLYLTKADAKEARKIKREASP